MKQALIFFSSRGWIYMGVKLDSYKDNVPESTDRGFFNYMDIISGDSIENYVLFLRDTKTYYKIQNDLTLINYIPLAT